MVVRGDQFLQGAQLQQQSQSDLIGRLMQMAQFQKEQKLKEDYLLDKKRSEAAKMANDPQNILTKGLQFGYDGLTPREKAIFDLSTQQVKSDMLGNQFNPMAQVRQQAMGQKNNQIDVFDMLTGQNQISTMSGDQINESQLAMPQKESVTNLPQLGIDPRIAQSPKVQAELATEAGKNAIKMQMDERKSEFEKKKAQPKVEQGFKDLSQSFNNIINQVDSAIEQVSPFSAGAMASTSFIGGTPAANLEARLNTIQADSAFDTLQKMREASKTGGALGSVSERELSLLRDARAPLGQKQSPSQLIESLNQYKIIRQNALKNVAEAYRQDYGVYPSGYSSENFDKKIKQGNNQSQEKIIDFSELPN